MMGTMAGWYTRRKNKSEYEAALCEKAERYGEQREREAIIGFAAIFADHVETCGYADCALAIRDFAATIERGEWR